MSAPGCYRPQSKATWQPNQCVSAYLPVIADARMYQQMWNPGCRRLSSAPLLCTSPASPVDVCPLHLCPLHLSVPSQFLQKLPYIVDLRMSRSGH